MALPKVCIIGAGCSGFTTAKRLKDYGIPFDIYEASDDIGGTWYYNNPNGMSACYQSLHIDTSKWRLAFEDYPVPADWPDYPHHSQLLQYFHDYVDHFGLRPFIRFNTAVTDAARLDSGGWRITLSTGEVKRYDALAVANGHHWAARIPEYPGTFAGVQIHSHQYRTPFEPVNCVGKRVLVVGMGNSAEAFRRDLDASGPVIEKLVNHSSGSFAGVVGIYQRHSFAAEKATALARWDEHIASVVDGRPSKIATLKREARS